MQIIRHKNVSEILLKIAVTNQNIKTPMIILHS